MKTEPIIKIQTSHAILRLADKYVCQLRDDSPDIPSSGQWSLFGGKLNDGETPLEAIKRELFEELSIRPVEFRYLWPVDYYFDFVKGNIRTWFFTAEVSSVWKSHELKEGRDVGVFSLEELKDMDVPDVMMKALERYHIQEGEK